MNSLSIRRFFLKNRAFAVRALGLALILGAAGAALWLAAEVRQ